MKHSPQVLSIPERMEPPGGGGRNLVVTHRLTSGRRALLAVCVLALSWGAAVGVAWSRPPIDWAKLHRPLRLPKVPPGAVCPVSRVDPRVQWKRINIFGGSGIGRGPVYPGLGSSSGLLYATRDRQYGGPWFGEKVFWYVLPSYRGRVLIRGRRLDGPQLVRFNGGKLPAPELRIEDYETVSWQGQPPGSRGVPSGVRVIGPGCYAFQIDGTSFSRIVVVVVDLAR